MKIVPDKSSVSIVILGSFNPAIFTPAWFFQQGLISKEEFDSSEVEVVHRELSIFKLQWLKIGVQQDRFSATTEVSPYIRLNDLVLKTFGELLTHTPLHTLGINRRVEFSVGTEIIRNKIGNMLAPPDVWGEWAKDITKGKENAHGGMMHLVMQQMVFDDRHAGHIRADVRPSNISPSHIFLDTNDQYEIENKEQPQGTEKIVKYLQENFEKCITRSEWIIDQLMELKNVVERSKG